MLKPKMTALSLTAFLAVSACSQLPIGDFCDIAEPIRFDRVVAGTVVTQDRATAKRIDAHNRYGERHCDW